MSNSQESGRAEERADEAVEKQLWLCASGERIAKELALRTREVPWWNREKGLLFQPPIDGVGFTARRVDVKRAKKLVLILDAFERAGWPLEIPNPLAVDLKDCATSRLRTAVFQLNKGCIGIRFESKDTHVAWKVLEPTQSDPAVDAK